MQQPDGADDAGAKKDALENNYLTILLENNYIKSDNSNSYNNNNYIYIIVLLFL